MVATQCCLSKKEVLRALWEVLHVSSGLTSKRPKTTAHLPAEAMDAEIQQIREEREILDFDSVVVVSHICLAQWPARE